MVGAIVVEVVVVPQAGWERVGYVVVVVVVQWSLEEAGRGEGVVGTQSRPSFCVFQLLVLLADVVVVHVMWCRRQRVVCR